MALPEYWAKISVVLFTLVSSVIMPAIETITFAGFMIFIDTVTGIMAASNRGEKVSSTKLKRVVSKLIVYPLAVLMGSFAEYLLPAIPFLKASATLLIVVEGTSVLENINDILGFNLFQMVKIWITDGKDAMVKYRMEKIKEQRESAQQLKKERKGGH